MPYALDELSSKREDERRAKLETELAGVERECERLADAVVRGGSLAARGEAISRTPIVTAADLVIERRPIGRIRRVGR